jgi:hypothetical protein
VSLPPLPPARRPALGNAPAPACAAGLGMEKKSSSRSSTSILDNAPASSARARRLQVSAQGRKIRIKYADTCREERYELNMPTRAHAMPAETECNFTYISTFFAYTSSSCRTFINLVHRFLNQQRKKKYLFFGSCPFPMETKLEDSTVVGS